MVVSAYDVLVLVGTTVEQGQMLLMLIVKLSSYVLLGPLLLIKSHYQKLGKGQK